MALRRNVMVFFRGKFQNFGNLEWLSEYNIDKNAFDFSCRKSGISLFARLKNGEDFLEKAIESHLPYVDEIVLVDNNSTDKTAEICEKFAKKFPKKVKFFRYTPDVVGVGNEKWAETPENSVHSLVHYYNWTLSKTTCQYVMKLDDDIIATSEISKNFQKILASTPQTLYIVPLINIFSDGSDFLTSLGLKTQILPPIAGIYCDYGLFPVSSKTYFVKARKMEAFIFPFGVNFSRIPLFHLKWLKKTQWRGSYEWKILEEIASFQNDTEYAILDEKFSKKLRELHIFPK